MPTTGITSFIPRHGFRIPDAPPIGPCEPDSESAVIHEPGFQFVPTLRDQFAMHAPLTLEDIRWEARADATLASRIACLAKYRYLYANAMIRARSAESAS